jgi:tRNA A37 threonylcarbamoyltransferase TsaD
MLWKRIGATGQILWSQISLVGSDVADLEARSHDDLQNLTADDHTQYLLADGSRELAAIKIPKTITAGGVTGNQTINKSSGTVNFAAAASSLTVTNSLVSANSIIIATIGTNDTTMTSVQAVAGAGSFVIYANAAATAETRVNFIVTN